MGYYCDCSGSLVLRHDTPQVIIDRLKEIADDIFTDYAVTKNGDNSFLVEAYNHERYREDALFEYLATAEPYTESGSLEFLGEDGAAWQELFCIEKLQWLELPGEIVYRKEDSVSVYSRLREYADSYPNCYTQYLDRVEETKTEEFLSQTPAPETKPEAKPEDVNPRNFVEEVTRIRTIQFGNDSSEKWKEPDDE